MEVDGRQAPRDPLGDLGEVVLVEGGQHGLDVEREAAGPRLQRREPAIRLLELDEIARRAADEVVPLAEVVEGEADREGLPLVLPRLQNARDDRLDLIRNDRVGRHRHVRGVVAAIEELRDLGELPVERRLAAGEHDGVEGPEIREGAIVFLELQLEMAVDVEVVPVEAGDALRVAEVRHPEDEVARKRVAAAEPVGGELEVVHRAAGAKTPRPMPARRPARYVRWCAAKAKGTAGKSARSRLQIGNESAQLTSA